MFGNNVILIKENKNGINTTINTNEISTWEEMCKMLVKKLSKRKRFYEGNTLIIKADSGVFTEKQKSELRKLLISEVKIHDIIFEDFEDLKEKRHNKFKPKEEDFMFEGISEGKTKFIQKTIRSGQAVTYNGNLVVIGDINSGAEISAAGNVIVLGKLSGRVTAGNNGNDKAIIAAFLLQPEILKIAGSIAMSPEEKPSYPEVAKVKEGAIVVEPYMPNKFL